MVNKLKEHKFLVIIVLFASILRLYKISDVPPALNWDEVSHGYNAFSILKTGKDEWGEVLPTIFRAYGDYKLPVYIYTSVVSVFLFGLNELSVRLPSVLAGVGTVIFTYALVKELFDEQKKLLNTKKLALISSLLVALEPWSLFLSRGAFEANLALILIVTASYFFVKGITVPKYFLISSVLFGLSVWTYNSARVFVPIFLLFLFLFYKKVLINTYRVRKKDILISGSILVIFLIPMFWQLAGSRGQARYEKVSILDQGAISEINSSRNNSRQSPVIARILHNKVTYFLPRAAKNWASHYSLEFLFTEGGDNHQFSVPGRGIIYPINGAFLILGTFLLLRSMKKGYRSSAVILFWFFSGSLASSLTREAPHVLRAITMLPAPMIISAYGLTMSIKYVHSKWSKINQGHLIIGFLLVLTACSMRYLNSYFKEYPIKYSQSWQYGNKEMVEYVKENYEDFDKVVITKNYGEVHEFILFYWPWDPSSYRNDPNLVRFEQSDWYWVDKFDKFYFVNSWQINDPSNSPVEFDLESRESFDCYIVKCVLITGPGKIYENSRHWYLLDKIHFLDGEVAYEIYQNYEDY